MHVPIQQRKLQHKQTNYGENRKQKTQKAVYCDTYTTLKRKKHTHTHTEPFETELTEKAIGKQHPLIVLLHHKL